MVAQGQSSIFQRPYFIIITGNDAKNNNRITTFTEISSKKIVNIFQRTHSIIKYFSSQSFTFKGSLPKIGQNE